MSDTPESTGLFAKRYIDLRATTALTDVITSQLRDVGLVTLDGLQSRAAVVALASALMRIAPHRDSEPDGLTVVQDTGRHTARSGFAGLTNVELAAHTERSGAPAPPRLMLLACGRPAASGGECVLIDGHDVYTDLARHHPDAAEALSDERAGLFGGQNGTFSPVFRHHPSDRISIRLRLDDLALWNPSPGVSYPPSPQPSHVTARRSASTPATPICSTTTAGCTREPPSRGPACCTAPWAHRSSRCPRDFRSTRPGGGCRRFRS